MNELQPLIDILSVFLGEPNYKYLDSKQIQFNCPVCADNDGVESDGKYNLEVNCGRNIYKCWRCSPDEHMSGRLSNLIKRFGGEKLLHEYRDTILELKKSKEYEISFEEGEFEIEEEFQVKLPEPNYIFKFDGNKKEQKALEYLLERGFDEYLIKKYDFRYTDNYCSNKKFNNRVIIPSYDKYNELNYFTGRDYTGKNPKKYYNFEHSNRKEIIFNEHLINWDADVVLVEGPTDHVVIPNSIPLLGKALNEDFYLFKLLTTNIDVQNIIVFLDDDAYADAIKICDNLSNINLCNKLKIVPTKKLLNIINKSKGLDLEKLDPSKLYEKFGSKGISWAFKNTEDYICK